jgi:hypothetical protein
LGKSSLIAARVYPAAIKEDCESRVLWQERGFHAGQFIIQRFRLMVLFLIQYIGGCGWNCLLADGSNVKTILPFKPMGQNVVFVCPERSFALYITHNLH